MKKQFFRIISMCLCICMLATGLPELVRAEGEETRYYDSDQFFTPVKDAEGNDTTVVTKEAKPQYTNLGWGNGYGLQIKSIATGEAANGSSAKLVSGMTGDIAFNFSPIPAVTNENPVKSDTEWWETTTYAFRKLTFRFRDLEHPEEYFDFVVHNYASEWGDPNVAYEIGRNDAVTAIGSYVEYNNKAYATKLSDSTIYSGFTTAEGGYELPPAGGNAPGSFRGTGEHYCIWSDMNYTLSNNSMVWFKWDSEKKQILMQDTSKEGWQSAVVADLDDSTNYNFEKTFTGFDYYSVEIIINEVQENQKAGVLIYAVQMPAHIPTSEGVGDQKLYFSLSNADRTDTHAPIVVEDSMGELAYLSDALTGTFHAIDMETGWIEADAASANVKLWYKKQGSEDSTLAVLNSAAAASAGKGIYEVYAAVTDINGNASEKARVAVCGGKKTYYDSDMFFIPGQDESGQDTTVIKKGQSPEYTAKVGDYGLQITSKETGNAANGSNAMLVSGMTGDISLCYSPIPMKTTDANIDDNIGNTSTHAFRKMTFRFQDLENPGNYFDYVVHNYNYKKEAPLYVNSGSTDYGMLSYVAYNGKVRTLGDPENVGAWSVQKDYVTVDELSLPPIGGNANGSLRGTGLYWEWWNEYASSWRYAEFKWDSEEKQILTKRGDAWALVADLDDSEYDFGEFTGFDYYSVKIIFDDVEDGQHAGVLINSIIMPAYGFSLWCDRDNSKNLDTHAPIVVKDCLGELSSLKSALTAEVCAIDLETGVIQAKADETNINDVEFWYKEQGTDDR